MKKFYSLLIALTTSLTMTAQGWPAQYGGVMLQAFYWDSFTDTQWSVLEEQADELASAFELVWLPQSGNCGGQSMGYDDLYWFTNYNSSFGNETELRSLIQTFKQKGIKTIADVVINHRKNASNWVDFPKETYNGVTYEMKSTDICANDDGGATKTWATQNGYQLSNSNDTGEDWGGMRDLDHKSQNVQNICKAYLDFLKNDLGYSGFRYDMVKGYSATYTGIYNVASQPEFSVGECWDGTNTIKNWIEGTRNNGVIQSAAFDFQFKYTVRNATDANNWGKLTWQNDGNWPLISNNYESGKYRRYAVTFVENHDTEVRPDGTSNGPLKKDTLAANAYLLAMPGTPCVFMKHWQAYPTDIKAMIAVRKGCGINNMSSYTTVNNSYAYFTNVIDDRLRVTLGNTANDRPSASEWVKVLSGYHYAYYMATSMNTAWSSLASSTYVGEQKTMLTAVTATTGTNVVYTLDGGAQQQVSSGTTITIPLGTHELKCWLEGSPNNVLTRNYVIQDANPPFVMPSCCTAEEGETCAFFEKPKGWTGDVKCWAWDDKGNYTGGTWPGATCTLVGQNDKGRDVWKWSWNGQYKPNSGTATGTQPKQIIFSASGSQTKDMDFQNTGYYTDRGLQGSIYTGIFAVTADKVKKGGAVYDLQGRRIDNMQLKKGLYIVNGKKAVIK